MKTILNIVLIITSIVYFCATICIMISIGITNLYKYGFKSDINDDCSTYSSHFAHIAYDFKPRSLLYSILGLMACSVLTNDSSSSGDT